MKEDIVTEISRLSWWVKGARKSMDHRKGHEVEGQLFRMEVTTGGCPDYYLSPGALPKKLQDRHDKYYMRLINEAIRDAESSIEGLYSELSSMTVLEED